MAVTVRWLLEQRDLGLGLRAGAAATDVPITFVITTELADPTPWLTGGEMLLTTGIGIPPGDEGCRDYVRRLIGRGVSALGFGVGVSRASAPSALVAAADEVGLALVDVPLPTPFVAVARTVIDEIARRANRSQVAAGRAQQRMTRAAVTGGPSATLRELAMGSGGAALLLDRSGRVVQAHPADVDAAVAREVGVQARSHVAASAVGPVTAPAAERTAVRGTIVTQPIRVGDRGHGHLGVVLPRDPSAADHVLIGHANSLLALDFERPLRLRLAQWRMNAAALRLVLSAGGEFDEAAQLVGEAADPSGVRAFMVRGGDADVVVAALRAALHDAGRPVFVSEAAGPGGVVALLGGDDGLAFADTLVAGLAPGERGRLQLGLGAPHAPGAVAEAVTAAELACRAARPGGRHRRRRRARRAHPLHRPRHPRRSRAARPGSARAAPRARRPRRGTPVVPGEPRPVGGDGRGARGAPAHGAGTSRPRGGVARGGPQVGAGARRAPTGAAARRRVARAGPR
ncbi:purine catabolism regulator [Tsukamurella ocularis]|nr:purine catabolism regulator [Tsukamurella ocularis]MCS3788051.1 purine catabolism regulator [Tsukamurella ocularis]MCS3852367.1 purine catabolism regulator [Tsukamurella ocularis]